MTTLRYTVTTKAGPKVAGRRAEPGDIIELTENAARAELLAGAITPWSATEAEGTDASVEPKKKR